MECRKISNLKIILRAGTSDIVEIHDNKIFLKLLAETCCLKTIAQAKDKVEKIITINKLKAHIICNLERKEDTISANKLNELFPSFNVKQCAHYIGVVKKEFNMKKDDG